MTLLVLWTNNYQWVSFMICSRVVYPPGSEASMEVANLTERKNLHTPLYGIKEFVCLSVVNFDPNRLYLSALFTMFASSENG